MAFRPDQIVGEYRIVRPLGQGGLGAVYEGLQPSPAVSEDADGAEQLSNYVFDPPPTK